MDSAIAPTGMSTFIC